MANLKILERIKHTVKALEPNAEVILYGSFARGDTHPESDIDILILVDKHPLNIDDKKKIEYPLYEIEFDTGQIINPLVMSKEEWYSKFKITSLFQNISQEGINL